MSISDILKSSETLSNSIVKLYRIGGFALAFGFTGIFLIVFSSFTKTLPELTFGLGTILTLVCLFFFLYVNVTKTRNAAQTLADNKEAIEAVQNMSMQLSEITADAQALGFKYPDKIDIALDKVRQIPFVGDKLNMLGINQEESASKALVEYKIELENLITETKTALISGDVQTLNRYSEQLHLVSNKLKNELKR